MIEGTGHDRTVIRPVTATEHQIRVSRPGLPDLEATLDVTVGGWRVAAAPWPSGEHPSRAVSGTSRDGLVALWLLSGLAVARASTERQPTAGGDRSVGSHVVPTTTRTGKPVVYFLGTHGLIHTLNLLGNTLQYCRMFGASLVPITELTAAWKGVAFHDVFAPVSAEFAAPDEHDALVADLPARMRLPIGSYREMAYGFVSRTGEHDCIEFSGLLEGHDPPGLRWDTGPGTEEALLTGGAPWPPPGVPNGWIVAMGGISVNERIRADLLHRLAQLPERYIGVHFRNTDSLSSLDDVIARTRDAASASGIGHVIWATDDVDTAAEAARLMPDLDVRSASVIPRVRGSGARGLHFLTNAQLADAGFSRGDIVFATLLDLCMLVRADVFVSAGTAVKGMETSWGGVVQHLREHPSLAEGFFRVPMLRPDRGDGDPGTPGAR